VVMTRATDVFIPLEERVQIARKAGADLFLSLHADSAGDATTHGASVYTLSERGEQRVGYVLDRNEWYLKEGVSNDDPAVGPILLDLTQRTTRNRSATFAQTLIERVGDRAPLLPRSQRDAGYFVLLAPDVPAALLEMGFITNPADEARLNDAAQRAALTAKIAQAIDAYFAGHAARTTRVASR
jgi:N-acetylmuramoyl-L-alanine amidase